MATTSKAQTSELVDISVSERTLEENEGVIKHTVDGKTATSTQPHHCREKVQAALDRIVGIRCTWLVVGEQTLIVGNIAGNTAA